MDRDRCPISECVVSLANESGNLKILSWFLPALIVDFSTASLMHSCNLQRWRRLVVMIFGAFRRKFGWKNYEESFALSLGAK